MNENQTLREKLNQDCSLQLPELDEDDTPATYFSKIQLAVQKRKRWKIRYQLTLGFLSFGKLAIWNDLDPKKWPALLENKLLTELASGGFSKGSGLLPEDYHIDNHAKGDLPLIYDADSSQHSAIIDALSGKNMVINGPPGTGKSQTITNIIAAGLQAGKKILFVSDKLAALEVVRHRLNQANLGHFCLELHSHKTQKKKLINDLQERIESRFRPPQQLQDKIATLNRYKKELNRYAELIASRVDNELGLTVYEIFWRTERHRRVIGDLTSSVQSLYLSEAQNLSYDDIEMRRAKLEVLGQLYAVIGSYDFNHPWWGFAPQPLAPGDDEAIKRIIQRTLLLAEKLAESVVKYQDKVGDKEEPSIASLFHLHESIQELPEPPNNLQGELLTRVFGYTNLFARHYRELVMHVIREVERARGFNKEADSLLSPNCETDYSSAEPILNICLKELSPSTFTVPLIRLEEITLAAEHELNRFQHIIQINPGAFFSIKAVALENLNSGIQRSTPLKLLHQTIQRIKEGTAALTRETNRLGQSFERIRSIAYRYDINFDGSQTAIAFLSHGQGIREILSNAKVDDAITSEAQKATKYFLSDRPIIELNRSQQNLQVLHARIGHALDELSVYSQQLGFLFDGTEASAGRLLTLCKITAAAPFDLMDYRCPSLAQPRALELLCFAEEAHTLEKTQRSHLAEIFHLDALPEVSTLKANMYTFRQGDSLFNMFNSEWRSARNAFGRICKTKVKRKAADYETHLSNLITWIEYRASFIENNDFKNTFGALFTGISTDFSKIRRLHTWYADSYAQMLIHPGLTESFDLSYLESNKISQFASLSSRLQGFLSELRECRSEMKKILGADAASLELTLRHSGWTAYNKEVLGIAEGLKHVSTVLGNYVQQDVTPLRAAEVLNAQKEFQLAHSDLITLSSGRETLQKSVEPLLPGIMSISCNNWNDYLAQLSALTHEINMLVEFVGGCENDDLTLADIQSFLEAKLALDDNIEKIVATPKTYLTKDWGSYISVAEHYIEMGAQLLQVLKSAGQISKSAKEIIHGLRTRKDANDIISSISGDKVISQILQGFFQGVNTDLDSLSATLSYGESVVDSQLSQRSQLKAFLLSSEASSNFYWEEIISGKLSICVKLSRVSSVSWLSSVHLVKTFGISPEEMMQGIAMLAGSGKDVIRLQMPAKLSCLGRDTIESVLNAKKWDWTISWIALKRRSFLLPP